MQLWQTIYANSSEIIKNSKKKKLLKILPCQGNNMILLLITGDAM